MILKQIIFVILIFLLSTGRGSSQPVLRLLHQIRIPQVDFYTLVQPQPDKLYFVIDTGLGLECREISDTTATLVWRKAGLRLRYDTRGSNESFIIALGFNLGCTKITLYLIDIASGIILDQLSVPIKSGQRLDIASYRKPYFLINLFSENISAGLANKHYLLFKIEQKKIKPIDQFDFEATIHKFFIRNGVLYGSNYAGCNHVFPLHGLPDCSPCFFAFSLHSHRVLNRFTLPEIGFAANDFFLRDSVLYFKYSSNSYTPSPYSGLSALSFPALKPLYHKTLPFTFNVIRLFALSNTDSLVFPLIDETHDAVYFFKRRFNVLKKINLHSPTNFKRPLANDNYKIVNIYSLYTADFDDDQKKEILVYNNQKKLPLDPRAAYLTDENGDTWTFLNLFYIDDSLSEIMPLVSSLKIKGEKFKFFYFEHHLLLISTYSITWFEFQ